MKNKIYLSLLLVALSSTIAFSQNKSLPNKEVKTLDGNSFNITNLENKGNPIVISFWATWCKPCIKELDNIADVYDEWQEETGVKLIAISIDDSRGASRVPQKSSDWEYEVYLDSNGDLKRAMGVSTVPHTFLLNSENKIVWQHKGYIEGDEDILFEKIQTLSK